MTHLQIALLCIMAYVLLYRYWFKPRKDHTIFCAFGFHGTCGEMGMVVCMCPHHQPDEDEQEEEHVDEEFELGIEVISVEREESS